MSKEKRKKLSQIMKNSTDDKNVLFTKQVPRNKL